MRSLLRFKKENQAEIVQLRQRWKDEITKNIKWIDDTVGYGEAIIRDVKRTDKYPETDEQKKRISAWFRVGLLGTYHRGLQVVLGIEELKYDKSQDSWRLSDYESSEKADLNAYLIGRILYEWIVSIDWEGDEYYPIPHLYCRFWNKRKEPYEDIVFCEKRRLDQFVYYTELSSAEDVYKLEAISKKV